MTILTQTLQHPRTLQSVQTIKRHIASPRGLDVTAALRLLRRNVRDASPRATRAIQWDIAQQVLHLIRSNQV